MHQLLTAIRIHRQQQARNASIDISPLQACITSSTKFSKVVVVGVDASDTLLVETIQQQLDPQPVLFDLNADLGQATLILLPISPYIRFTIALNALLSVAIHLKIAFICYSSVEMRVLSDEVDRMMEQMTPTTLVVGKAFYAHQFKEGRIHLGGFTSPWNTFAIWRVDDLATTGFLMVSDMNTAPGQSAIEEVPTISLLQQLRPSRRAVLLWTHDIDAESDGWQTNWKDQSRHAWQVAKLKSKDTSARSHLNKVGLNLGIVEHIYALGI